MRSLSSPQFRATPAVQKENVSIKFSHNPSRRVVQEKGLEDENPPRWWFMRIATEWITGHIWTQCGSFFLVSWMVGQLIGVRNNFLKTRKVSLPEAASV